MPVSSRRNPGSAQPPLRPLPSRSPNPQLGPHMGYTSHATLYDPRDLTPAPPYREDRSPDPFTNTRALLYGPSGGPQTFASPAYESSHGHENATTFGEQSLVGGSSNGLDHSQTRLPYFEAALARNRSNPSHYDHSMNAGQQQPPIQPMPTYLPPSDPNHPALGVTMMPSSTVRFAMNDLGSRSRSPSPQFDDSYDQSFRQQDILGHQDVEKALLEHGGYSAVDTDGNEKEWNEKLSSLGLLNNGDEGDLALPPFLGSNFGSRDVPAIHVRGPTEATMNSMSSDYAGGREMDLHGSSTQHFGPAPIGRVGRRTHNARRIKQAATLDENGFFAVDMPIPTRLAQFLPVKGVEEQKSTRYDLSRFV